MNKESTSLDLMAQMEAFPEIERSPVDESNEEQELLAFPRGKTTYIHSSRAGPEPGKLMPFLDTVESQGSAEKSLAVR